MWPISSYCPRCSIKIKMPILKNTCQRCGLKLSFCKDMWNRFENFKLFKFLYEHAIVYFDIFYRWILKIFVCRIFDHKLGETRLFQKGKVIDWGPVIPNPNNSVPHITVQYCMRCGSAQYHTWRT